MFEYPSDDVLNASQFIICSRSAVFFILRNMSGKSSREIFSKTSRTNTFPSVLLVYANITCVYDVKKTNTLILIYTSLFCLTIKLLLFWVLRETVDSSSFEKFVFFFLSICTIFWTCDNNHKIIRSKSATVLCLCVCGGERVKVLHFFRIIRI